VHVWIELADLVTLQATECLVRLNVAKGILSPGANRHDLALILNHVHNIAQSFQFTDTACRQWWDIKRAFSESQLVRVAILVDNLALALTCEHGLELFEYRGILHFGSLEYAKLPRIWLAPEHCALWEVFVTDCVLADCDVVVSFDSFNFSPKIEHLELHGQLECAKCVLKLHALFCAKSDSRLRDVLKLFRNFVRLHFRYP